MNNTEEGFYSQIKPNQNKKNLHGFLAIFLQTLYTAVGLCTEYLIQKEI